LTDGYLRFFKAEIAVWPIFFNRDFLKLLEENRDTGPGLPDGLF
jgi:hypothetical protein